MLSRHHPAHAGLLMLGAMASFSTNDTCMKYFANGLPVGEITAIRGAAASLIIAAVCYRQCVLGAAGGILSRGVLSRAALDLLGTLVFIACLTHMPIANLTAIIQAAPLVVILFAATILRERVGWRRFMAVIAGMFGVLLVVQPSPQHFSIYDVSALSIVVMMAARDIITRRITLRVPTLIVALGNAVIVTLGGLAVGLFEGFAPIAWWQLAGLLLAACFLSLGYMFMVATLRVGEIAETAPYRYSMLLFSIIYGVVIFGEYPDSLGFLGMALVVGSGLYALHRELLLRHKPI
jgi:drug/metabolite transporter (DMT)-like permease